MKNNKNIHIVIVAAGEGSRFGGTVPKQFRNIAGKPVLRHAIDTFSGLAVTTLVVVCNPDHKDHLGQIGGVVFADGGHTRRQSVYNGLLALRNPAPDDIVLIHDAARPLLAHEDLAALLDAMQDHDAATLATPVADTLAAEDGRIIDRTGLWAIQTPQAFRYEVIRRAHDNAQDSPATDDTGLVAALGLPVKFVAAKHPNFKITTPKDFILAEKILSPASSPDIRTGSGYDVHAFDDDINKGGAVRLCGIDIPHERRLAGHSDADVGLHALTDAILGAIGEGDIGLHFPPSDMSFKDMDSAIFLRRAVELMQIKGGSLLNADITLICEAPKVGPHRDQMRARVAEILSISAERVNIKATTTEKLGFTGRCEGIAAQAAVSVLIRQAS